MVLFHILESVYCCEKGQWNREILAMVFNNAHYASKERGWDEDSIFLQGHGLNGLLGGT